MPETLKKISIRITLGLLCASAFFVGLTNFKGSTIRSIDEVVYTRLGAQLSRDLRDYNSIPYGKELTAQGRPLPEYFFRPLYKHPPLFSMLIAGSMKIFGRSPVSAAYIPLLFGALFVLATFYLARELFSDDTLALCAAFIVWLDPFLRVCAQKIWLDIAVAFFMFLALTMFIFALRREDSRYFLGCGAAMGLALLTKYTGILAWCSIIFYAAVYRRDLFKDKYFVPGLLVPFVALAPWVYWNYKVYGGGLIVEFLSQQPHAVAMLELFLNPMALIAFGAVLILAKLISRFWPRRKQEAAPSSEEDHAHSPSPRLKVILATILFTLLWPNVLHSVLIDFAPRTSWRLGAFLNEPPLFYVAQLMDFSLVYVFAFLGVLFVKTEDDGMMALRSFTILSLAFFIFWKNYQSRYILSILPGLIIMALAFLKQWMNTISNWRPGLVRLLMLVCFWLLIATAALKLYFINIHVAFPNDLCYF